MCKSKKLKISVFVEPGQTFYTKMSYSRRTAMSRTDRVCAHGLGVGGEGEEPQAVEDHPVEEAVDHALGGQQHDEHHHELGVEDQEPGDDAAHDAAAVADEPHGVGAVAERGRGAVLGSQVASLPLDVPGAERRAHHPTAPGTPTTC